MNRQPPEPDSITVMQRADALGAISEEPDILVRRYGTPAMQTVNDLAADWMREAGMEVRRDSLGNVIGRYAGEGPGTLVLGSHLDTVRDAGKYDGPLGVLVAIACVRRLHARGAALPFSIEVAAFADEEGLRFGTAYLGSKGYTGSLDPAYLELRDADGITLADAVKSFGGDPVRSLQRSAPDNLIGYCEVHIEQGPVLERDGLPVGIVTAISSQARFSLEFVGEAGHAGTVPMSLRRDALCAAAEFIVAAEALAREQEGLVATVGQIEAQPGASNVIPGRVTLSLDVRHMDDTVRETACESLRRRAKEICERREIALEWKEIQAAGAVACSPDLSAVLGRAVDSLGYPVRALPSGAGHDGVVMSRVTPFAMLFVRCKGGISHNPTEAVDVHDVASAIAVLERFVDILAGPG